MGFTFSSFCSAIVPCAAAAYAGAAPRSADADAAGRARQLARAATAPPPCIGPCRSPLSLVRNVQLVVFRAHYQVRLPRPGAFALPSSSMLCGGSVGIWRCHFCRHRPSVRVPCGPRPQACAAAAAATAPVRFTPAPHPCPPSPSAASSSTAAVWRAALPACVRELPSGALPLEPGAAHAQVPSGGHRCARVALSLLPLCLLPLCLYVCLCLCLRLCLCWRGCRPGCVWNGSLACSPAGWESLSHCAAAPSRCRHARAPCSCPQCVRTSAALPAGRPAAPLRPAGEVQCFPLPADLPVGRYLRVNLHGKRQRQLEDMQVCGGLDGWAVGRGLCGAARRECGAALRRGVDLHAGLRVWLGVREKNVA